MKCPKCHHDNAAQAKFCEQCATPLARVCGNCGSSVSATAKFCSDCGHLVALGPNDRSLRPPKSYTPRYLADQILTARATLEGERKLVTVVFADVAGSMQLLTGRDPEDAHKLLDPAVERMIDAVHRYEGTVNRVMATASWRFLARRSLMRITLLERVTRRSACKRASNDIRARSSAHMECP